MITLQDKLAAVERLIEDLRWAREKPDALERETFLALKEIAKDIRARMDGVPQAAVFELESRVNAIRNHGSSTPRMHQLAAEFISRWPVIKQALERFGAMAEAER